jgi:LasA protease
MPGTLSARLHYHLKAGMINNMRSVRVLILVSLFLFACNFPVYHGFLNSPESSNPSSPVPQPGFTFSAPGAPTLATLGAFHPGDTIQYPSQPGDTLPNLAGRFQTTVAEILTSNPSLQTTPSISFLTPGTQIQIKVKQEIDLESGRPILPNDIFVNGPSEVNFNIDAFIDPYNGWLKEFVDNSSGNHVTGVQIVRNIALNYSISPRLILALLEYQLQALSNPAFPASYSLGNQDENRKSFTSQISWMANTLNNGFYRWQDGKVASLSGMQNNLNPLQNSATVALLYYFSQVSPAFPSGAVDNSPGELIAVYQEYFGPIDWSSPKTTDLLPPGLSQPKLILPFGPNDKKWSYTGGPHSGWGVGDPLAAVDFAPPAEIPGCDPSPEWALAITDGVITRADDGLVILDPNLDEDNHPETGWAIQYLHLFPTSVPGLEVHLKQGDPIGHPSCVGGHASGRHVHIARLYNGVWISASEVVPFNLDGWEALPGNMEYEGLLIRDDMTIHSSIYGGHESQLSADPRN